MDVHCYRRAPPPLILSCLYHSVNSLAAWDTMKPCFTEIPALGFEMIPSIPRTLRTPATWLWPCTRGSDCCAGGDTGAFGPGGNICFAKGKVCAPEPSRHCMDREPREFARCQVSGCHG